jgi:hypothetical protein
MEVCGHAKLFACDTDARAFDSALIRAFSEIQKQIVAQYLRPENAQRFRHRGPWSNPGNDKAPGGDMQTHSAVLETRFDEIANNDLTIIERNLRQLREAIDRQFAKMFYSTVEEACNQSGNTIDARAAGSLEAAFISMLEKIELGIDKDGTVSLPEIHASPELGERMLATLEGTSQEYQDRIEALKARKTAEAVAREAERKARFVRYGPKSCAS